MQGVKRDTPHTHKEYREGVKCAPSLPLYRMGKITATSQMPEKEFVLFSLQRKCYSRCSK